MPRIIGWLSILCIAACGKTTAGPPPIDLTAEPAPPSTVPVVPIAPPSAAPSAAPESDVEWPPLETLIGLDAGAGAHRISRPPRAGWPLAQYCDYAVCTTPQGEPGVRYTDKSSTCPKPGACFNPCPIGMAPGIANHDYCEKICRTDTECGGGHCQHHLCNSREEADHGAMVVGNCLTSDRRFGYRVEGDARCYPWCKIGLMLHGGTECVKPCTENAECPGGECTWDDPRDTHFCGPLVCPSEGCPYPWE